MSILELFCDVEDFWQQYGHAWEQHQLTHGQIRRHPANEMHPSEIMTVLIHFHQSCYRTFKHYYLKYVQVALCQKLPRLLSYTRLMEVMTDYVFPLTAFLHASMGVRPIFLFAIIFGLYARFGTLTLYTHKTVARFAQGLAAL